MKSVVAVALVLVGFVAISVAQLPYPHAVPVAQLDDKVKLRFKLSGRSLPDKDTLQSIDPYVELYYTENDGTAETKLGRTETLNNNKNPDWSDIFTFDFDRNKRQRWHFIVRDHDLLARDDKAGEAWLPVSEYVDSKQYKQVNLKKGYLIIQKV